MIILSVVSILVDFDPDDVVWPLRPIMWVLVVVIMTDDTADMPIARVWLLFAFIILSIGLGIAIEAVRLSTIVNRLLILLGALLPVCTSMSNVVTRVPAVWFLRTLCTVYRARLGRNRWCVSRVARTRGYLATIEDHRYSLSAGVRRNRLW